MHKVTNVSDRRPARSGEEILARLVVSEGHAIPPGEHIFLEEVPWGMRRMARDPAEEYGALTIVEWDMAHDAPVGHQEPPEEEASAPEPEAAPPEEEEERPWARQDEDDVTQEEGVDDS